MSPPSARQPTRGDTLKRLDARKSRFAARSGERIQQHQRTSPIATTRVPVDGLSLLSDAPCTRIAIALRPIAQKPRYNLLAQHTYAADNLGPRLSLPQCRGLSTFKSERFVGTPE